MVGTRGNIVTRDASFSPELDSGAHSPLSDSSDAHFPLTGNSDAHAFAASVVDIGGSKLVSSIKSELETKFLWKHGRFQNDRLLPASLMHDDVGLKMWRDITLLPNYYQTGDEIELLQQNSGELAEHLARAWSLIDLGCGDVRKIKPLLDRLEYMQIPVDYYANDLSRETLVASMQQLGRRYRYVRCAGLWGSFEDVRVWAKKLDRPKCIISLGSMLGNDHFDKAVARLRSWVDIMQPHDRMLLGLDATQDKTDIWKSYHDDKSLFYDFVRNGFAHSNQVLGHDWYRADDWIISGAFQDEPLMHHFTMTAVRDVECEPLGLSFPKNQKIICYEGFKYDAPAMAKQFTAAGLKPIQTWTSPSGRINQYMLSRAATSVP